MSALEKGLVRPNTDVFLRGVIDWFCGRALEKLVSDFLNVSHIILSRKVGRGGFEGLPKGDVSKITGGIFGDERRGVQDSLVRNLSNKSAARLRIRPILGAFEDKFKDKRIFGHEQSQARFERFVNGVNCPEVIGKNFGTLGGTCAQMTVRSSGCGLRRTRISEVESRHVPAFSTFAGGVL